MPVIATSELIKEDAMSTEDNKARDPLPEQHVVVPDWRGVEVGQPPSFRDPKNRKRQTGSTGTTHMDRDAAERFWGID